ncbi:unnamed protein product [Diamesa tonsa]
MDKQKDKKIPKGVQDLKFYDRESTDLADWINDGNIIIELFAPYKDTPAYEVVLREIRNKIVGVANLSLIKYNTPLSWECIKHDLKKDLLIRLELMKLYTQFLHLQKKFDDYITEQRKLKELKEMCEQHVLSIMELQKKLAIIQDKM